MQKEEVLTIDKNIYGLANLLVRDITTSSIDIEKGLTELISIVNNWGKYQHMSYADYVEEVLNWAYENFPRDFYDKIYLTIKNYSDLYISK